MTLRNTSFRAFRRTSRLRTRTHPCHVPQPVPRLAPCSDTAQTAPAEHAAYHASGSGWDAGQALGQGRGRAGMTHRRHSARQRATQAFARPQGGGSERGERSLRRWRTGRGRCQTGSACTAGDGAPGGIRTPDQWLRKPLLYPAELRAQRTRILTAFVVRVSPIRAARRRRARHGHAAAAVRSPAPCVDMRHGGHLAGTPGARPRPAALG